MNYKIMIALIAFAGAMVADAETTYFRDSTGRLTGSVTTDGNGKTVYKDGQGRIQRTVTTDRNGKTTFRDNLGRTQGTVQTDARGKTTWRDASGRVQGSFSTDQYGKTTWRDSTGGWHGGCRHRGVLCPFNDFHELLKAKVADYASAEAAESPRTMVSTSRPSIVSFSRSVFARRSSLARFSAMRRFASA